MPVLAQTWESVAAGKPNRVQAGGAATDTPGAHAARRACRAQTDPAPPRATNGPSVPRRRPPLDTRRTPHRAPTRAPPGAQLCLVALVAPPPSAEQPLPAREPASPPPPPPCPPARSSPSVPTAPAPRLREPLSPRPHRRRRIRRPYAQPTAPATRCSLRPQMHTPTHPTSARAARVPPRLSHHPRTAAPMPLQSNPCPQKHALPDARPSPRSRPPVTRPGRAPPPPGSPSIAPLAPAPSPELAARAPIGGHPRSVRFAPHGRGRRPLTCGAASTSVPSRRRSDRGPRGAGRKRESGRGEW